MKNKLKNKKILFVGDSITASSDKRGWPARIADSTGAFCINAGVKKASISTTKENRIITQLEKHSSEEYDIVILHGGVNDAWDSVPVGEMSDSFSQEDFDINTFAGALEELFAYAKSSYRTARFGYIVNYSRPTSSVESLCDMSEYFGTAKKICDKWEIPYFDMYFGFTENGGERLYYSRDLIKTESDENFISEGNCHISASGYDVITPYIEKWIESLI